MHALYTVSSLTPSHPCAVLTFCVLVVLLCMTSEHLLGLVRTPFLCTRSEADHALQNWRDILRAGRARRSSLFWFRLLLLAEPLLPLLSWLVRLDPRRTRQLEGQLTLACEDLKAAHTDLVATRDELASACSNEDRLRAELEAARSELNVTRDELAASHSSQAGLRSELEAAQSALAEANTETASYKAALERSLDNSLELELELNAVERAESMLHEELADRKADLAEAEADYVRLQREMRDTRLDTRHAALMAEARIEELEMTVRALRRPASKPAVASKPARRRADSGPSSKDLLVPPPADAPISFTFPRAEMTINVHPPAEPEAELNLLPKQTFADALAVWPHYRNVGRRTLRGFEEGGRTIWVMWDRGCEWRKVRQIRGVLAYAEGGVVKGQ